MTACPRPCAGPCRLALECGPYPCAVAFVADHPDGATLEQVGAALGVTRECVHTIEERAAVRFVRAASTAGMLERGNMDIPFRDRTHAQHAAITLGVLPARFEHPRGFDAIEGDDEP